MATRGKKKGKTRKNSIKLRTVALALLVGGGLLCTSFSLFFLSARSSKSVSHDEPSSRTLYSKRQNSRDGQKIYKPHKKESKAEEGGGGTEDLPKVAIIIDDMGFDVRLARFFLELRPPLTLSVLPTAPHATAVAQEAMARGVEVLLHLPMEPKERDAGGPGAGVLLAAMGEEEFVETLSGHLSRIPGVKGVNNHMGSLLTEREDTGFP
jgi:hypothetical protein